MQDSIDPLDALDLRLLDLLQRDASLTNHELARRAHVSPATCLRRVKRLVQSAHRRSKLLAGAVQGYSSKTSLNQ